MKLISSVQWVFIVLLIFISCQNRQKEIKFQLINTVENSQISFEDFNPENGNQLRNDLKVYIGDRTDQKPEILGEFELIENAIIWTPTFQLKSDTFFSIYENDRLLGEIRTPGKSSKPPFVTHVFPSSDTLPQNILKFYIHFSEPMSEIGTYDNIFIIDENQNRLDNPFVVLNPPLWNADHNRLTIWIDPGRIKRGLISNEEKGQVFLSNKSYKLILDNGLRSAQEQSIKSSFVKSFFISSAVRHIINPDEWRIDEPVAESDDMLKVFFGRKLDHALLEKSLAILNEKGELISGDINISKNEMCWEFTPEAQWLAGRYQLEISSELEDLAGNNLIRPFDRDIENDPKPINKKEIYIPFTIKE